ncbi:hypothetical protein ml_403 [Mollivirus sibericum]|uniref:hypothetical protein n=1 Tax=Mollivirus sibericum TaxID=1678078 RepID=UPI0006B2DD5B|nr:hypothetical protein ml_403 [Mollivirus sibericum]ALD62205.1 hypothetical protein ml_403 [Mollivirus sibericum]
MQSKKPNSGAKRKPSAKKDLGPAAVDDALNTTYELRQDEDEAEAEDERVLAVFKEEGVSILEKTIDMSDVPNPHSVMMKLIAVPTQVDFTQEPNRIPTGTVLPSTTFTRGEKYIDDESAKREDGTFNGVGASTKLAKQRQKAENALKRKQIMAMLEKRKAQRENDQNNQDQVVVADAGQSEDEANKLSEPEPPVPAAATFAAVVEPPDQAEAHAVVPQAEPDPNSGQDKGQDLNQDVSISAVLEEQIQKCPWSPLPSVPDPDDLPPLVFDLPHLSPIPKEGEEEVANVEPETKAENRSDSPRQPVHELERVQTVEPSAPLEHADEVQQDRPAPPSAVAFQISAKPEPEPETVMPTGYEFLDELVGTPPPPTPFGSGGTWKPSKSPVATVSLQASPMLDYGRDRPQADSSTNLARVSSPSWLRSPAVAARQDQEASRFGVVPIPSALLPPVVDHDQEEQQPDEQVPAYETNLAVPSDAAYGEQPVEAFDNQAIDHYGADCCQNGDIGSGGGYGDTYGYEYVEASSSPMTTGETYGDYGDSRPIQGQPYGHHYQQQQQHYQHPPHPQHGYPPQQQQHQQYYPSQAMPHHQGYVPGQNFVYSNNSNTPPYPEEYGDEVDDTVEPGTAMYDPHTTYVPFDPTVVYDTGTQGLRAVPLGYDRRAKRFYLRRLNQMIFDGAKASREFTEEDSIQDIQDEIDTILSSATHSANVDDIVGWVSMGGAIIHCLNETFFNGKMGPTIKVVDKWEEATERNRHNISRIVDMVRGPKMDGKVPGGKASPVKAIVTDFGKAFLGGVFGKQIEFFKNFGDSLKSGQPAPAAPAKTTKPAASAKPAQKPPTASRPPAQPQSQYPQYGGGGVSPAPFSKVPSYSQADQVAAAWQAYYAQYGYDARAYGYPYGYDASMASQYQYPQQPQQPQATYAQFGYAQGYGQPYYDASVFSSEQHQHQQPPAVSAAPESQMPHVQPTQQPTMPQGKPKAPPRRIRVIRDIPI